MVIFCHDSTRFFVNSVNMTLNSTTQINESINNIDFIGYVYFGVCIEVMAPQKTTTTTFLKIYLVRASETF